MSAGGPRCKAAFLGGPTRLQSGGQGGLDPAAAMRILRPLRIAGLGRLRKRDPGGHPRARGYPRKLDE